MNGLPISTTWRMHSFIPPSLGFAANLVSYSKSEIGELDCRFSSPPRRPRMVLYFPAGGGRLRVLVVQAAAVELRMFACRRTCAYRAFKRKYVHRQ